MAIIVVPDTGTEHGSRASRPANRTQSSRGRKAKDNLTGYAFLIGAVVCFAFFS